MLPTVHGPELIIILVIILLLFGARRIPELAKGLGTGVREFRRGTRGDGDEVEEKSEEEKKSEELNAAEKDEPETRTQEGASAEADKAEQKPS